MTDAEEWPASRMSEEISDDTQEQQRKAVLIQDIVKAFSVWKIWPEAMSVVTSGSYDEELYLLLEHLKDKKWSDITAVTDDTKVVYAAFWSVGLLPASVFTYFLPGIFVAQLSASPHSQLDDGDFVRSVVTSVVTTASERKPLIRIDVDKMDEHQKRAIANVLLFYHDVVVGWKDRYRERLEGASRSLLSPASTD